MSTNKLKIPKPKKFSLPGLGGNNSMQSIQESASTGFLTDKIKEFLGPDKLKTKTNLSLSFVEQSGPLKCEIGGNYKFTDCKSPKITLSEGTSLNLENSKIDEISGGSNNNIIATNSSLKKITGLKDSSVRVSKTNLENLKLQRCENLRLSLSDAKINNSYIMDDNKNVELTLNKSQINQANIATNNENITLSGTNSTFKGNGVLFKNNKNLKLNLSNSTIENASTIVEGGNGEITFSNVIIKNCQNGVKGEDFEILVLNSKCDFLNKVFEIENSKLEIVNSIIKSNNTILDGKNVDLEVVGNKDKNATLEARNEIGKIDKGKVRLTYTDLKTNNKGFELKDVDEIEIRQCKFMGAAGTMLKYEKVSKKVVVNENTFTSGTSMIDGQNSGEVEFVDNTIATPGSFKFKNVKGQLLLAGTNMTGSLSLTDMYLVNLINVTVVQNCIISGCGVIAGCTFTTLDLKGNWTVNKTKAATITFDGIGLFNDSTLGGGSLQGITVFNKVTGGAQSASLQLKATTAKDSIKTTKILDIKGSVLNLNPPGP